MNSKYVFRGAPEERIFGALPPGDYAFVVASADPPYSKNDHWILAVKLTIQPQGVPVFANPWSGTTSTGEDRDGIAEFLIAVNRAPAPGYEPDWAKLVGAKGKCRLKTETAQMGALAGKEVNKVAFFHRPHQLTKEPAGVDFSKMREAKLPQTGPKPPAEPDDLDMGPVDIPF